MAAVDDSEWRHVQAPWTPSEMNSLNAYQTSEVFHPYTCHRHGSNLVATLKGWRCPAVSDCNWDRSWAWQWTVDNSWRQLRDDQAS
jgi:hypothetical protein